MSIIFVKKNHEYFLFLGIQTEITPGFKSPDSPGRVATARKGLKGCAEIDVGCWIFGSGLLMKSRAADELLNE